MNNDASKAIAELERMHSEGKRIADDVAQTFEKNKGLFTDEDASKFARLSVSPFVSGKKHSIPPETQVKMDEFERATKATAEQWIDDVFDTLKRTAPQARYRLQFQEANEVNYTAKGVLPLTSQGSRVIAVISDLKSHVTALHKIITAIDEATEKRIAPAIQRAKYDPIARTLYFAGKEISFTKNAKYPPEICKMMFADLNKEDWKLSDFYDLWQPDHAKAPALEDWQRIQDVMRKFNARIKKETKISDLFIFRGKSVHLNRNYIG